MNNLIEFNREKAIVAVLYVAQNLDISDKIRISKVLYAADKYHLNHYFRFILGDTYARLENGSVPSSAYNMLKNSCEAYEVTGHTVVPLHEPDMDELSPSDIEALNYGIEFCKGKSFQQLSNDAHDDIYDANKNSHWITVDDFVSHMENEEALRDFLAQ